MSVLECLSRFEMRFNVKDYVFDNMSLLNISPLNTVVSRKFVSFSDISVVNLMVGWYLFASKMKRFISSLLVSHKENTSSIYLSTRVVSY